MSIQNDYRKDYSPAEPVYIRPIPSSGPERDLIPIFLGEGEECKQAISGTLQALNRETKVRNFMSENELVLRLEN